MTLTQIRIVESDLGIGTATGSQWKKMCKKKHVNEGHNTNVILEVHLLFGFSQECRDSCSKSLVVVRSNICDFCLQIYQNIRQHEMIRQGQAWWARMIGCLGHPATANSAKIEFIRNGEPSFQSQTAAVERPEKSDQLDTWIVHHMWNLKREFWRRSWPPVEIKQQHIKRPN